VPVGILLSKIISVFVLPIGCCIFLAIAGLVVARWRWKLGAGLVAVAVGLLWACSTPALSSLLVESLEQRYPAVAVENLPSADAIVVLGGAVGVR